MSRKNKSAKPAVSDLPHNVTAAVLPMPMKPEEVCSPTLAFKITVGLFTAIAAFFVLRLFFLSGTMGTWDDIGPMRTLLENEGSPTVLMRNWSYAPGQYFLTQPLIHRGTDYWSILFWARLPSLIMWLVGLVATFWSLRGLLGREYVALSAALTVWAAVSWRGLLESSQAYNFVCTLPCVALLTWLFVSQKGFAWMTEPAKLWRPVLAGLVAGLTCWFTYQSLFVAAGGFLFLGAVCLKQKAFTRFKGITAAGLAFSGVFLVLYEKTLKFVQSQGIGWPGGIPGDTVLDKITFLPRAWFEVLESTFTFVPPPLGSKVVEVLFMALLVWGGWKFFRARRYESAEWRLVFFTLIIVAIWSAAPYKKIFPLSPTRHTYVLQFPLLACLGLALKYLHVSRRVYAIAATVIVGAFVLTAPTLWHLTKNQFDPVKTTKLLEENPRAILLNYPNGTCLDFFLLGVEHPDFKQRMADGHWAWPNIMKQLANYPGPVYLMGAETPIGTNAVEIAGAFGLKVVPMELKEPTGSIEIWRQATYTRNGSYLYRLESQK